MVCSCAVLTEPGPDQWPAGPAGGGHEGETGHPGEGEFTLVPIQKCIFTKSTLLLASEYIPSGLEHNSASVCFKLSDSLMMGSNSSPFNHWLFNDRIRLHFLSIWIFNYMIRLRPLSIRLHIRCIRLEAALCTYMIRLCPLSIWLFNDRLRLQPSQPLTL